ncbi:MORC family CW-type zinc finger protein 3a isoform X2 [Onychostoma macrolepis]|uniref:MORC family CW-type zinc finger protein 3a isoform X2 n=1 Tax=Onychostoma macrolepis TaxID=369639 RepID=UPI00272B427B|nr:MORC family CW-type zinc finger protein 3a isoform X2 [Onychostoma macrolepis]
MAVQTERGIPLSALNPKFLHTNSTSHTWPFSAIAELIDNAYDPDVSAKQFWIDRTTIRGQDCLTFMDNGAGMNYDKMYKMLSFGFSDKETINGHVPVGLYGNGFKSGSMRLGKDTIVFSKNGESMCVGLLSQTYLQEINAENVIVPIVSFKRIGKSFQPESQHAASLQDILRYSLFQTEAELLCELSAINAHYDTKSTGTRIIIWNLRKTSTDKSEFDFDIDRYDIQIPSEVYESEKEKYKQPSHSFQSSPESDFSLRAYCSILYLKPRMQIIIRGQKVKTQLISKSLASIVKHKYKPNFLNRESIPIVFGYNTKSKDHYGVMMYHKNRLIKAYERVGCQTKANEKGVGVIAVIECNFLKPTHNKQDFDYTEEYRKTMITLGVKLEEYWKAIRHEKGLITQVPVEDIPKRPDQNWVQCDDCLKWRKLPDGIDMNKLPEKWFCRFNPDPLFRRCEQPEEAEDSEDETSDCLKTYKQHERNIKKQQEQQRTQMEETRLRQEQQKNAELLQQNENLKRKVDRVRQLYQKGPSSPRSPSTSLTAKSPFNSTSLSQSASSPSDSMPVISNVMSLSTPKRTKRSLGLSPSQTVKRARTLHDYCSNTPDGPSTSAATSDSIASPLAIAEDDGNEVDENNVESSDTDDVVIDETHSTPRPKPFDLSKVKLEKKTSEDAPGLYMECSDQASIETENTGKETMEASTSSGQTSITTQTERFIVKTENGEQIRKEEGEIKKEETENDARRMEQSTTKVESRKSNSSEIECPMEIERCISVEVSRPSLEEIEEIPKENKISFEQHAKSYVENQEGMTSTSKTSLFSDIQIDLMPTHEAQKQQDNLLDLLEATARERDEFRKQAQEKEIKLLKLTMKKDCSHQCIQTDPSEEQHYKTLYLQATQSIDKLTQERDELKVKQEVLLQIKAEKEAQDEAKKEGHSSTSICENVDDEMALQVDFLLRELDSRNTECNELKIKLESLEQEKAHCEQLQKEVEELRKQREQWNNARERETLKDSNASSEQTCNTSTAANLVNGIRKEGESSQRPVEGENGVTPAKLRELRCSIARLLVTFVPALDLDQVNYDCEVIDEILNQVIQEISPS